MFITLTAYSSEKMLVNVNHIATVTDTSPSTTIQFINSHYLWVRESYGEIAGQLFSTQSKRED